MTDVIRVLLIEDDEDDHLITTELLEDIDGTAYEVTWVDSARAGIEALLHDEHDVCLLDFGLGSMTGIEVLTAVRDGLGTAPCILLTGQDNGSVDRAAAEAGAVDYLIKGSFSAADLERAIRYAVGNAENLRSLRESEARFRSVVEAAYDGILLLDASGQILTANVAAHDMVGAEHGALVGMAVTSFLAPRDLPAVVRRFNEKESTGATGSMDACGVRCDGSEFPLQFSVSGWSAAEGDFWSLIVRDATEHRNLVDQLAHQAFHDPLTGLANRTLLRQRIEHAAESLDLKRSTPALIMIDLDDFKRINDTVGHETGDRLLKMVSQRLSACVRQGETVARMGGDEFALFVESYGEAHTVVRLAERVLERLEEPFKLGGTFASVRASIGVALLDRTDACADELVRDADLAMYAAKRHGRHSIEVFQSEMHGQAIDRIRMEEQLAEAIANEDIELHYQPLVDLSTGRTIGFEALARWSHPLRGPVPPPVFIEVAEDSGQIAELGRMVLSVAVHQAAEWQRRFPTEPPITISVNLSSRQLEDPQLVGFVSRLLSKTGLAPRTLILEVTESVMMGDFDDAVTTLSELRRLGARLALDDFGTGYSSLSYLRTLPIDILKLDRSFVIGADGDQRGTALVEMIAVIGQTLGLTTVAEGIETPEQRDMLAQYGYDRGQGYLFARPLPAAEAARHLNERLSAGAVARG